MSRVPVGGITRRLVAFGPYHPSLLARWLFRSATVTARCRATLAEGRLCGRPAPGKSKEVPVFKLVNEDGVWLGTRASAWRTGCPAIGIAQGRESLEVVEVRAGEETTAITTASRARRPSGSRNPRVARGCSARQSCDRRSSCGPASWLNSGGTVTTAACGVERWTITTLQDRPHLLARRGRRFTS